MKNSVRKRLFLQVSFIVVSLGALIMLLISQFLGSYYVWNEKRILADVGNSIKRNDMFASDFKERMAAYESKYNVIIDIYYDNGISYYTTFYSSVYQRPDNVLQYRPQRMPVLSRELNTDGSYYDVKLEAANNIKYLVFTTHAGEGLNIEIYAQKDVIEASADIANRFILMITVAGVLIGLVWAYFYSRRFTNPLVEMNAVTQKMSKMDFTQKCKPDTGDEIGQLGVSINNLSDALDQTLCALREKNEQLEHDIEKERNMEKMRQEFIANVSHELKTPIAIIQGYAEGLEVCLGEDTQRCRDYAEIIMDESQKMNRLVLELLELSKYDSGHQKLNPEIFNIRTFTEKILEKHGLRLDEFNILTYNNVGSKFEGFGDVEKLERVLNNYIVNAISHVKEPRHIIVSCEELCDCYRLSVFNSGKHIPADEMQNIWISFYRSDKAHHREQGRVGLGLSIVKAIQELHGLGYGVQNCDGGVSFWFDIKKAPQPNSGAGE